MLNFKSVHTAGAVITGIELMHMIRKGQVAMGDIVVKSFAKQIYSLAGMDRAV